MVNLTVDNDPRARVVVLRGLPASGKSTLARDAVLNADVPGSVVRINNDDLSAMLYGAPFAVMDKNSGALLAEARTTLLRALLTQSHVRLIIVDNTNLSERTVRDLEKITVEVGARFEVDDSLLNVDVDECVRRDAARQVSVGEQVIRRMHRQATGLRPWRYLAADPVADVKPYINDQSLPSAVIVDVDGTLALMEGRGPFDWHRVGEDVPNMAVVGLVKDLIVSGENVIIMSGRDGVCRAQTEAWLDQHVAPGLPLYMRAAGDQRKDSIIKYELFQEHIAGKYHVRFVLDDRDQVVDLWRNRLALPTFQVANGNF
jgi:predicted kinase